MSDECNRACYFALDNCESVQGQLNYKIQYDPVLQWLLICKPFEQETISLSLSGQEVALELIKELPLV